MCVLGACDVSFGCLMGFFFLPSLSGGVEAVVGFVVFVIWVLYRTVRMGLDFC